MLSKTLTHTLYHSNTKIRDCFAHTHKIKIPSLLNLYILFLMLFWTFLKPVASLVERRCRRR